MARVAKIEKRNEELTYATRPPMYNEEMALEICYMISCGFSMKQILREEMVPGAPKSSRVVMGWLFDGDHPVFTNAMKQARLMQCYGWADECIDIADNSLDVQRDRLKIETRKWFISKLLPKMFGERISLSISPDGDESENDVFQCKVVLYLPNNNRTAIDVNFKSEDNE